MNFEFIVLELPHRMGFAFRIVTVPAHFIQVIAPGVGVTFALRGSPCCPFPLGFAGKAHGLLAHMVVIRSNGTEHES